jgi:hypothetical protein
VSASIAIAGLSNRDNDKTIIIKYAFKNYYYILYR